MSVYNKYNTAIVPKEKKEGGIFMNTKKIISLVLSAVLFIGVLPISTFAVTGMGIEIDAPYAGKGTVSFSWDKVSKADGYQFSLRYLETGDLYFDHEDATGTSVDITRKWKAGQYRVWVGAYRLSYGEDKNNSYTWAYQEEYVFTIEECCSHGHVETAWDTSKTISYKSISDSEHTVSGYVYSYCTDCLDKVETSIKVTETEGHQFNKNGDCILCDYTSGCEHPDTILTIIDGYPSYTPYNEYHHKYTIHYDKLCKDCFETVSKNVSAETGYEDHDFDNNGICRECKYVKPSEQAPLTITVSSDKINAETGETIFATASASGGSGLYKFAWKIGKNKTTVYETDLSYGSNYSYTFTEEGTYTVTVTVKDGNGDKASASCTITVKSKVCKHSETKYELGDTEYTSFDQVYHTVNNHYDEICIDCRKTVNSKVESSYEEHTFDGKGICTKCGCVRTSDNKDSGNDNTTTSDSECKHSVKREKISSSLKQMSGDKKEHYVVSQYREYCDCGYIDRTFEETSKEACVLTSQRIEAEHHAGLGHKLFSTCKSCGYAYYEGYSTLSSCEFCTNTEPESGDNIKKAEETYDYALYCNDDRCAYYLRGELCVGINTPIIFGFYDKNNEDVNLSLSGEGLHLSVDSSAKIDGLVVTFYEKGSNTVKLVRNSDGKVLVSLDVYVSRLEDINGRHTSQTVTDVVTESNMEEINWKKHSCSITTDVVICDYRRVGNVVRFDAYNRGQSVYAVASYDAQGREIDRAYIQAFVPPSSIVEDAIKTFGGTGRLIDSKNYNESYTEETEIEINVVSGGYIRILEYTDGDVFVKLSNYIKTFEYFLESENSLMSLFSPNQVQKIIQQVGKENVLFAIYNAITREFVDFMNQECIKLCEEALDIYIQSKGGTEQYIKDYLPKLIIRINVEDLWSSLLSTTVSDIWASVESIAMQANAYTAVADTLLSGVECVGNAVFVDRQISYMTSGISKKYIDTIVLK